MGRNTMQQRLALAAAVLALSACGSEKSGTFETEDGGDGVYTIDPATGESSAKITTDEGTASFRSGANVKADLPAGWSIYPGAEVISATNIDGVEGRGTMVTMESDDSVDDLIAHYRSQAQKAGLEIKMEMTIDKGRIIAGTSRDGRQFSLNVTTDTESGKAQAQLMVASNLGG